MKRAVYQSGFSYLEVLIAIVLIMLMLVPGLEALQTGALAARVYEDQAQARYALAGRMESVLALNFAQLSTEAIALASPTNPSALSDPAGSDPRLVVYLAHYDVENLDGDNDPYTATSEDPLEVQVSLEGSVQSLRTLTFE